MGTRHPVCNDENRRIRQGIRHQRACRCHADTSLPADDKGLSLIHIYGCLNRLKHLNVEQQHIDRLTEATRAEMNQGYRAVSYTHLDVYKRQQLIKTVACLSIWI